MYTLLGTLSQEWLSKKENDDHEDDTNPNPTCERLWCSLQLQTTQPTIRSILMMDENSLMFYATFFHHPMLSRGIAVLPAVDTGAIAGVSSPQATVIKV